MHTSSRSSCCCSRDIYHDCHVGLSFLQRFLVKECGVDIQQTCETGRKDRRNAMHWAARNGHTEVCAWLHRPVDVNSEDCTTPDATHAEVVAAGVDVDACTTDGTVAFHWACWQGQFGEQECCMLNCQPALDLIRRNSCPPFSSNNGLRMLEFAHFSSLIRRNPSVLEFAQQRAAGFAMLGATGEK